MRSFSSPGSRPRGLSEERRSLGILSSLDWGLILPALLLAAMGLATVHSASAELPIDYLPRQALWIGFGLVAFVVAASVDYHLLIDMSLPIFLFGLMTLVLVLVIGEGPGGTKSWLAVGSMRVGQPAELAKIGTVLFLARFLAMAGRRYLSLWQVASAGAIVALPMILIALQPDYGSAAMFVPLLAGMLLISGLRLRFLIVAAVVTMLLGAGVWTFGMRDYQRERVSSFLSPGSDPLGAGYQVRQSQIAVGSGEFAGRGYKQGTQSQLRFLPARHTDFIFAVLAEEWGFVGVITALGLYVLYIVSALRVGMRARDRAGILIVVGFVSVFTFHALYNTAMVVGLLPITGIPLPFLSYGGSFMLLNFAGTGLIVNVDLRRYVNR